jgi:hypothetical protein
VAEPGTDSRRSVDDALAAARTALAGLATVDLDASSEEELTALVPGCQALRGQLETVEAAVLSRWDARRCWAPSGAKTGSAWLAWQQRIPIQVARQRLRHARALRTLPAIAEAWAAGEIDRTHLATLLAARTPRTGAALDAEHELLLGHARRSGFKDFKRRCDQWEAHADPDGADQAGEHDHAAREVHLTQSFQGMWFGRMTFDPINGQIVDHTLREIEAELFEAEWATAKAELGRDPKVHELARTPAQRRADALVEMATRARTAPADGRRPAPLFTVVVGYETFAGPTCELFNRTVLTPRRVAQWLDQAYVERIVFDSPSRVVDVGAARRFYRGALRRAIEVRDRTCYHPSCDDVPPRLEVDHITPASQGGPTTQANGQGACGFHNRRRVHHPDPGTGPDPGDPHAGPDPP